MEGLIHRVDITRRITVAGVRQWEGSAFIEDYRLRIDPVSPNQILREVYANCTHRAIGDYNLAITQGMRMTVTSVGPYSGKVLLIAGTIYYDVIPAFGHQNEFMLVEITLSV